jgi:hypothetical protein
MKFILGLAFALFIAGCDAEKNDHTTQIKMNGAMKSHCLGHSVIDLPEEYSLKSAVTATFTPDQNLVEDGYIDLVVEPETDMKKVSQRIAERHAELGARRGITSNLSQVRDMPDGGKLFRVQIIDDAYRSEVHWMLNGTYLVGSIKSFKNQVAQAEVMLLDFVRSVEPQRTVGPSASFCLGGVMVTGKYLSELASFHFASPQMPDTSFSVDINTYEKDDKDSLHQRLGGPDSLFKKFNIKESILRKTETTVAGMRAQEWISVIRPGEKDSDQDLSFLLETMRPIPSPAAPKIHLEMDVTGASAHDEKAALALWDGMVKTIRQTK